VGHVVLDAFKLVLGVGRLVLPVLLIGSAVALLWNKIEADRNRFLWGIALTLVSVCGIGHLAGGRPGLHAGVKLLGHAGGWLGSWSVVGSIRPLAWAARSSCWSPY